MRLHRSRERGERLRVRKQRRDGFRNWRSGVAGVDVDVDSGDSAAPVPESVASLFPDPETFSAFAASVETHARTTAERLKEVAMGYAADASRCLRAAVAASAEDAAASSR